MKHATSFRKGVEKLAFVGDVVRSMMGYHNLNEISSATGIPKRDVASYYHGLRAPNKLLYSQEDVAKDIKDVWSKKNDYDKVRTDSGLFKSVPGSKEEADIMKIYGKDMDQKYIAFSSTSQNLMKKYDQLKNPSK